MRTRATCKSNPKKLKRRAVQRGINMTKIKGRPTSNQTKEPQESNAMFSSRGRRIKVNRHYHDYSTIGDVTDKSSAKLGGTKGLKCPTDDKSAKTKEPVIKSASSRKTLKSSQHISTASEVPTSKLKKSKLFDNKIKFQHSTAVDLRQEHCRWQAFRSVLGAESDVQVAQYLLDWFEKTAPPQYNQTLSEGTLNADFMQHLLQGAQPLQLESLDYGTAVGVAEDDVTEDIKPLEDNIKQDVEDIQSNDNVGEEEEDCCDDVGEHRMSKLLQKTPAKDCDDSGTVDHPEILPDGATGVTDQKAFAQEDCENSSPSVSDSQKKAARIGCSDSAPATATWESHQHDQKRKPETPGKRGRPVSYVESEALYIKTEEGHYMCKECNVVLTTRAGRKQHEERHIDVQSLTCNVCNCKLPSLRAAVIHKKSHMRGLQCELCPFAASRQTQLHAHMKEIHNMKKKKTAVEPFICNLCGKSYAKKHSLVMHQKLKHSDDPQERHICEKCGKSYLLRASLKVHYKNHEAPKHKCPKCGQMFYVNSTLQLHMNRVHFNLKKYQCEDCGKLFKVKMHMHEHRYAHHLHIRPFTCPHAGCDKAFFTRRHQMVHTRIHTGEKPIKCKMCDYSCRQTAALQWHMRKHMNPEDLPPKTVKKQKGKVGKVQKSACESSGVQDHRGDHVYSASHQGNGSSDNKIINGQQLEVTAEKVKAEIISEGQLAVKADMKDEELDTEQISEELTSGVIDEARTQVVSFEPQNELMEEGVQTEVKGEELQFEQMNMEPQTEMISGEPLTDTLIVVQPETMNVKPQTEIIGDEHQTENMGVEPQTEIIYEEPRGQVILTDVGGNVIYEMLHGMDSVPAGEQSVIIMDSSNAESFYETSVIESPDGHQMAPCLLQPNLLTGLDVPAQSVEVVHYVTE